MILLSSVVLTASAQQSADGKSDSIRRVTFPATSLTPAAPAFNGRTIDMTISGGPGYYTRNSEFPIQGTLGADFSGRTADLDLIGGFHWGFSEPSTMGLSLGMRFPISEAIPQERGLYGDASLLFFDDGRDSAAFHTGLRTALTMRTEPLELRLAAELRNSPLDGERFEAWVGAEVGFVINLSRSGRSEPTRKDSLHAALKYIATTEELDNLDEAYSTWEINRWLDLFWQARNVTESPSNDARQEYMRRIAEANERYGIPRKMGVATDQGRVLLIYGNPDRIEDGPSSNYSKYPERRYELWIEEERVKGYRTAVFLFVADPAQSRLFEGHGTYREVYSNLPDEPSEGVPPDLPASMLSYINSFAR